MANPDVTIIPAKRKYDGAIRAAIYARVSSAKKDQIKSLGAQLSALTTQIAYMPKYVLFDTYIDIASGSALTGRPGFQRLVEDCAQGKIKYVLVKSASRFSRDIIVAMEAIRKITLAGAKIHFMAEGIDSDNRDLQVYLAAHLAVTEMDNLSRSENIKWGIRVSAEEGMSKIYNKICYGYKHDNDGNLAIKEDEAKNVRLIYRLYLDGYSVVGILKELKRRRILSPTGKENWNKRSIEKMLSNSKYAGDATIETDQGAYVYTDHHPAIIARDAFDAVQTQKSIRSNVTVNDDGTTTRKGNKYSGIRVTRETLDLEQLFTDHDIDPNILKE